MKNIHRIQNNTNGTAGWQVRVFRQKQGVRFDFNKYFGDKHYYNNPAYSLEAAQAHRTKVYEVLKG